jgi:flagellar hook-length control protein FliK
MFSNFLAIVTGRLFGKSEATGMTQSEESPNTATDGVDNVQGFLPILMQLLPNPLPVPASPEGDVSEIAVSGIGEENTVVTGISFSELKGKTSDAPGIMRFSAVPALSSTVEQEEVRLPAGSSETVRLPELEKANVARQLPFFGSQDEAPVPMKEAPASHSAELRQHAATGNGESPTAQGDKQMGQILEGMSIVKERVAATVRPIRLSGENARIENVPLEKSPAPPQSLKPDATPAADIVDPRDVASVASQTGSEKAETQERSPQTPGKQVTDIGERPKETGSVQPDLKSVRQGLQGLEIGIPEEPSGSPQDESGQSQSQSKGDILPAPQRSAGQTVKTEGKEPDTDEPARSSSPVSNTQDGTPAPQAAVATKGEAVHTVSQHPSAHTVQAGTTDVTATGSPAAQQMHALPPDITRSVIDQVARELAQRIGDHGSEIRLMLKPETLGELALKVKLENGAMTAQIDVTQAGVKAALESNLADLRLALQSKGIEVRSIDIFSQSSMGSSAGGQTQSRSHSNGRRRYAFESSERYQSSRQLGYNTIEIII